jgi:hypothetical protein
LSTLVVQMHPAVQEGLQRLHEAIIPDPEWLRGRHGIAWPLLLFMLWGVACVVASRRLPLIVAGAAMLGYFVLFDSSLASHFFRIYLPLFPVFFLAAAAVASRLLQARTRAAPWLAWILILFGLATPASLLKPPRMPGLEMFTPSPALLTEKAYMVNSTTFHPESLIYRFPDKKFIGLPLEPDQVEDFQRQFPEYRAILWHDFNTPYDVQKGVFRYLRASGRYRVQGPAANRFGRQYVALKAAGE